MSVSYESDIKTRQLIWYLTPLPSLLEIIPPTLKNLAVHLRICTRKAGPTLDKVNFSDLDHFLTKSCSSFALVHSE